METLFIIVGQRLDIDLAAFVSILSGKKDNAPILMQEFLPGDEYSVDLLADHGKVICATGRRNVVIDNSIPMESILKRLLWMIPVILGVIFIVFSLLQLTPGDPARVALGTEASEERLEEWREEHGLNKSFFAQ